MWHNEAKINVLWKRDADYYTHVTFKDAKPSLYLLNSDYLPCWKDQDPYLVGTIVFILGW